MSAYRKNNIININNFELQDLGGEASRITYCTFIFHITPPQPNLTL